jgi:DNA-binding MarR family transcriptional regulator
MNDPRRIRQVLRNASYEQALADRLGMNVTDLRCLELVIGEPGLSAGRLADEIGLTTGAVTGVLDRLERAGYVERRADPADRRRAVIQPTPAADEVRAELARMDETFTSVLGRYSAGEQQAIRSFLDATAAAVDRDADALRASVRGGFIGQSYQAPLADAPRGRLVFNSGAPRLSMNIAPLGPRAAARVIVEPSASRLRFEGRASGGNLIGASFDGPLPDVRSAAGVVNVRYQRRGLSALSTRTARIALSDEVPWAIEIEGGLTNLTGSLAEIALERLEINGGANHIDLLLPPARGTTLVRVRGVVSSARLRRPAGTPASLRMAGGVSHLNFDGQRYSQVSERRLTSEGFAGSTDRYEIEILDGAAKLELATR